MPIDTPPRSVGYEEREPVKAPPWHGLVAWDMLFNSLTTGLFLVTALGELVDTIRSDMGMLSDAIADAYFQHASRRRTGAARRSVP